MRPGARLLHPLLPGRLDSAHALRRGAAEESPGNRFFGIPRSVHDLTVYQGPEVSGCSVEDGPGHQEVPVRDRDRLFGVRQPAVGLPHVPAGRGRAAERHRGRPHFPFSAAGRHLPWAWRGPDPHSARMPGGARAGRVRGHERFLQGTHASRVLGQGGGAGARETGHVLHGLL